MILIFLNKIELIFKNQVFTYSCFIFFINYDLFQVKIKQKKDLCSLYKQCELNIKKKTKKKQLMDEVISLLMRLSCAASNKNEISSSSSKQQHEEQRSPISKQETNIFTQKELHHLAS